MGPNNERIGSTLSATRAVSTLFYYLLSKNELALTCDEVDAGCARRTFFVAPSLSPEKDILDHGNGRSTLESCLLVPHTSDAPSLISTTLFAFLALTSLLKLEVFAAMMVKEKF